MLLFMPFWMFCQFNLKLPLSLHIVFSNMLSVIPKNIYISRMEPVESNLKNPGDFKITSCFLSPPHYPRRTVCLLKTSSVVTATCTLIKFLLFTNKNVCFQMSFTSFSPDITLYSLFFAKRSGVVWGVRATKTEICTGRTASE